MPSLLRKKVLLDGFLCCKFCYRNSAGGTEELLFAYHTGADAYTKLHLYPKDMNSLKILFVNRKKL